MTSASSRGTCFGYDIVSPLSFAYLRNGSGEPLHIDVGSARQPRPGEQPVAEYLRRDAPAIEARLYEDSDTYSLFVVGRGGGGFAVDAEGPRITIPPTYDIVRREERLWGIPAALCFTRRGDIPLHAAALTIDSTTLLLAGPSGSGKTTLAAALLANGHHLLAEDLSCVQIGNPVTVLAGPAMLRVRADVLERLELGQTSEVGERDDRIHLALDESLRGDSRPRRIDAVLLLGANTKSTAFERIAATDALRELWMLSFIVPREMFLRSTFEGLVDFVATVPVFRVDYPRQLDALPAVVDAICSLALRIRNARQC